MVGLVIVLILANIVSITLFWMKDTKPRTMQQHRTPADFLIKELQLNAAQQQQFEVLKKEHQDAAGTLRKKVKNAKEELFDLLKTGGVADSVKHNAVRKISLLTEELDLVTFNHFEKVRAICTTEQQKKFDVIIKEVTRMMGQQRGGGERPPKHEFDQEPPKGNADN